MMTNKDALIERMEARAKYQNEASRGRSVLGFLLTLLGLGIVIVFIVVTLRVLGFLAWLIDTNDLCAGGALVVVGFAMLVALAGRR